MFKKLLIATLMLSPLTAYSKVSDKEISSFVEKATQVIAEDAIGNKKITAVINKKKGIEYISIKNGSCDDYDRLKSAIINTSLHMHEDSDKKVMLYLVSLTYKGAAKLNCDFAKAFK